MGSNNNIFKKIVIFLILIILISAVVFVCIAIFTDKMFMCTLELNNASDGDILLTDNIRKSFLESDYFANLLDIDEIPKETDKITVEDINKYTNLMNQFFIALQYNNELKKLKEPVYINKGKNYEYEYTIKSLKLIKLLDEVFGIKASKEELAESEKYTNSLYYNESDDTCYISSTQTNMEASCNFIGVEKMSKSNDIYTMELYHFKDNVVDTSFLPTLIEAKNNDSNIITGNFDNVEKTGEGRSCQKKKVTFKINSLFGKNKFKILSVENINN